MSLINDALRRAGSEKPKGPPGPVEGPPLEPVESKPAGSNFGILPVALLLLGVGVIAVAGVLWFKGGKQATQVAQVSPSAEMKPPTISAPAPPITQPAKPEVSAPVQKNPIETAAVTLQNIQKRNEEAEKVADTIVKTAPPESTQSVSVAAAKIEVPETPRPEPIAPKVEETKVAAAKPEVTPARIETPPPPAVSEPRSLRLQAIYYRMKGPTVVINGKTLRVGQIIDNTKVMSIQRTSVEVEENGKYRTLTLP